MIRGVGPQEPRQPWDLTPPTRSVKAQALAGQVVGTPREEVTRSGTNSEVQRLQGQQQRGTRPGPASPPPHAEPTLPPRTTGD